MELPKRPGNDDSDDDGDENDVATTTAPKNIKKNDPKRSENDPKTIRKRPEMQVNPVAQVRRL